ncbi:hypothetical protein TC41_2054 [Alicyclobacillus acidocaldarius subsp. acidocaldarius Tc-4-1]|uniref:Uncharacterized protein n=1 Tax=Alicyclobacillus acidocaldarius (strain Tc-4-1) TaxID=1048834 RepID=F8IES0_ALIAT|nr:hypothetical protein TC41_2054 [Alicyclobacillus acidocaldarius subsp. acidocaldarius Tc-4-1]
MARRGQMQVPLRQDLHSSAGRLPPMYQNGPGCATPLAKSADDVRVSLELW